MNYRDWATPNELKHIEAVDEHGSIRGAARALGVNRTSIQDSCRRAKARAAAAGWSPDHGMTHPVPEPFVTKRVSTLRDGDGNIKSQWTIGVLDAEGRQEALKAAAKAMAADLPRETPVAAPKTGNGDLCALYTLTDAHIGMLAWHREGGQDWDLSIAERTIVGCFAETIRQMPSAKVAILNQLGDLLHYDGLNSVTPTSGHILDADGRFTKMVEVAVRVLRRVITMLLEKHENVHVILAEGNHDVASSVWLRTMFKALYENEPRITVDDSALPYYAYEFGSVMLAFHHSHLKKNSQLPGMLAAQFAPMWGRTTKRFCHTGNLHHAEEKEHSGMIVIQHPTLAARDAYAARGGWHAERAMSAITYHRNYGQVGRVTVSPEMLTAP